MAALFSQPEVASAPVVAPAPTTPSADPEAAARAARLEALDRRRRGLAGTIASTPKGFLDVAGAQGQPAARKTLLGA